MKNQKEVEQLAPPEIILSPRLVREHIAPPSHKLLSVVQGAVAGAGSDCDPNNWYQS
jgi:hypothetical protein